jgi:chromate reductase
MGPKKNIFAIIGSAGKSSANLRLVEKIAELSQDEFEVTIFDKLSELPHFNPELSLNSTPELILKFRELVANAEGIIICTPEYVFSIPSGLKNAIEWCVSTTVFSGKPIGLITASASGIKGHEELKLIMRTVETAFNDQTTLLIPGIKGKIDDKGNISDVKTSNDLINFVSSFKALVENACG